MHPRPFSQLYLRSLANRTGQTFAYPDTSRQASAEIRRLLTAAPSGASSWRSNETTGPLRLLPAIELVRYTVPAGERGSSGTVVQFDDRSACFASSVGLVVSSV